MVANRLQKIGPKIRKKLDSKDMAREEALDRSREIIRLSANSIRAVHRGEFRQAERLINQAKELISKIQGIEPEHPDIYYSGAVQDAQKEYAEALATFALIKNKPLPDPDEINIGYAQYLCGLGEAIGELRRHILDMVREGKIEQAEELLKKMDDIYYFLGTFDYPDAISGGLRRIMDMARSVMERTRADLTTAIRQKSLEEAMSRFERKIKGSKILR